MANSTRLDIYGTFMANVHERPMATMISTEDKQYSFVEVDQLVNYLAARIEQLAGSEKQRILLSLTHSYKIIVAILAVLKTGHSYVPLRKEYGETEIKRIAMECGSTIVISDHREFSELQTVLIDDYSDANLSGDERWHQYRPSEEVYILYTSGSTGTPKGCSVTYGNLQYILRNLRKIGRYTRNSVVGFSTPFTFDVSVTEIYAFVFGASIVVCNLTDFSAFKKFPEMIQRFGVTHLAFSPSGFKNFFRVYSKDQMAQLNRNLDCVMLAGEVFDKKIFDEWRENGHHYRLLNLYGPTEATVYATVHELMPGAVYDSSIPIGQCLEDCGAVIDAPDGRGIGELLLYGAGISHGYINNQAANEKSFFEREGKRYYRTGDLVSEHNGLFYYHGRNDQQVQINGIRVELGEIEAKLTDLIGVDEGIVVMNDQILTAIIKRNDPNLTAETVIGQLKRKLPRYMIPNKIYFVAEFRFNASNKIDRKAMINEIHETTTTRDLESQARLEPASVSPSIGQIILRMMNECLQDRFQIELHENDDFFALGGDSLDTFVLLTKIENEFAIELKADTIYDLRTPKKIAAYLSHLQHSEQPAQGTQDLSRDYENIILLTTQVKKRLYDQEEQLLRKFPAIYLQKFYYQGRLSSTINFQYEVGNLEIETVNDALIKLIRLNPILHAKISSSADGLVFEEYEIDSNHTFPTLTMAQIDDHFIDFVYDNYAQELFYARYQGGFLATFIIIKHQNGIRLVGLLDHTIADAASTSLIKIKLGDILNKRTIGESPVYEDYCALVRANNQDIGAIRNSRYIQQLAASEIGHKKAFLNSLPATRVGFKIDGINNQDSVLTSQYISFVIGQQLLEKLPDAQVAVRNIVNLRKIPHYSFRETIGDLHVSISFVYHRHATFSEFKQEADSFVDLFAKKMFRHSSLIEDESLQHDPTVLEIKKIAHGSDLAVVNYLGLYSDEELESFKQNVFEMQSKLNTIDSRIYITAIANRDQLYIFTNRDISDGKQALIGDANEE